jgi:hypothetical protein
MVAMAVVLILAILGIGILFLRLHSLPERMAHKGKKFQFEIVAVLCLLALFTHVHLFWVVALLLALIDIPDIGGPLGRMAGSLESIAGKTPASGSAPPKLATETPGEESPGIADADTAPDKGRVPAGRRKEFIRA